MARMPACSAPLIVVLATCVTILAYVGQKSAHFTFTLNTVIKDVDYEVVRQFISTPELVALSHSHTSKAIVTDVRRDTAANEGLVFGTISNMVTLPVVGLSMTIEESFVLSTRGNQAHYKCNTWGMEIDETYSVVYEGSRNVRVVHQFNGTCPWILSSIAERSINLSHEKVLLNMKNKLEGTKTVDANGRK